MSKAGIRRQLQAALAQVQIVGSEVFYPAAWRFPDQETGDAQTSVWLRKDIPAQQHRLRIAVDYVEGLYPSVTGMSEDETMEAAVARLHATELAREAARLTGAQGGRKAASRMTAEARSARAKKAAAARWPKAGQGRPG